MGQGGSAGSGTTTGGRGETGTRGDWNAPGFKASCYMVALRLLDSTRILTTSCSAQDVDAAYMADEFGAYAPIGVSEDVSQLLEVPDLDFSDMGHSIVGGESGGFNNSTGGLERSPLGPCCFPPIANPIPPASTRACHKLTADVCRSAVLVPPPQLLPHPSLFFD